MRRIDSGENFGRSDAICSRETRIASSSTWARRWLSAPAICVGNRSLSDPVQLVTDGVASIDIVPRSPARWGPGIPTIGAGVHITRLESAASAAAGSKPVTAFDASTAAGRAKNSIPRAARSLTCIMSWRSGTEGRMTLKAVIGPGDQGEPVITIMFPEED